MIYPCETWEKTLVNESIAQMTLRPRRENALSRKERLAVMPKFDVTDEFIIDAPPMVVYKALLNEFAGVTHLFMPYYEFKLKGDIPINHEGANFDIVVRARGMTSKLSAKITKIVDAKSLEVEYAGNIIATEEYTFEPTNGKTKVKLRFNGRTNSLLMSLFSPFVNFGKGHTDMVQKGFKALNSYLNKK